MPNTQWRDASAAPGAKTCLTCHRRKASRRCNPEEHDRPSFCATEEQSSADRPAEGNRCMIRERRGMPRPNWQRDLNSGNLCRVTSYGKSLCTLWKLALVIEPGRYPKKARKVARQEKSRDDWRSFEPLIAACVDAALSPGPELRS